VERKLRAILSADVVGYSRIMAGDEEGTLARLHDCLSEIVKPGIADHHGRVVKLMGDGVLAEFSSAVDAVRCAVAVQEAMAAECAGDFHGENIVFRVGINVGDVIFKDGDIYGDGVNLAARLQELADPGGILISNDAYSQVRGKLDLGYQNLGPQSFKNIPEPVAVYRVTTGGMQPAATPATTKRRGRILAGMAVAAILSAAAAATYFMVVPGQSSLDTPQAPAERKIEKSIAVLPFDNMSGDPEQEYFADGMAEDIITDLSKVSGLFVIARNSSFAYKGQSPDIREVGRELGVGFVLEGSVRKAGGRIRINVQLIDAASGVHIWAERYDREEKDIFALQDEVRTKIVGQLAVKLTPEEEERLSHRLTASTDAYDLWLRGRRFESFFTKEANLESRRLFERAIEIDSDFAAAYASLGTAYSLAAENDWLPDRMAGFVKALELTEKAVELDEFLPSAHWALARVFSRGHWFDGDRAIAELRQAIALDPNYADAYGMLANVMNVAGNAADAIGNIEQAMRLNPRYPYWYLFVFGRSHYMLGDYVAAAENFRGALEKNPNVPWPRRLLIATYGQLGQLDDAQWEIEELRAQGYEISISNSVAITNLQDKAYVERYAEGLRKAGVPE
jgi:adenylate cyclase